MTPFSPQILRTPPPPVMEARRWIAAAQFPPDRPLLNVSQAAPVEPPPEALRAAMAKTMQEPLLRETMAKQNMGEGYLDAPEFKALIARDNAFFRQLIERLGIKA